MSPMRQVSTIPHLKFAESWVGVTVYFPKAVLSYCCSVSQDSVTIIQLLHLKHGLQ